MQGAGGGRGARLACHSSLPPLCSPPAAEAACLLSAFRCLSEERRGDVLDCVTRTSVANSSEGAPAKSVGGMAGAGSPRSASEQGVGVAAWPSKVGRCRLTL
jgi:hypothetical protein